MKRLILAGVGALAVVTMMGVGQRGGHSRRQAMPAKAPLY